MSQVYDLSAEGTVLKQRYETTKPKPGYYKDFPCLADLKKDTTLGGGPYNWAVKSAIASTGGSSVAAALSNGAPDQYVKFQSPNNYQDFSLALFTTQALDMAQGKENAMIETLIDGFDGANTQGLEAMANQVMGDGGNSRGQIASTQTLSSSVITLAAPGQAAMFRQGMTLQASLDDGTGTNNVKSGSVQVAGTDDIANTVTLTGPLNVGIPTIAASDFLFRFSDYGKAFPGLAGFNPTVAPTSSSAAFLGVTQYTNVTGLSGWRVTGSGASYGATLTDLTARMCAKGANPDRCYMNPIDWANLAKDESSRIYYDKTKTPALNVPELSFESFTFVHPKGSMKIIADQTVPQGIGRVIQSSELVLMSVGQLVKSQFEWTKLQLLTAWSDDMVQARFVSRAFLKALSPMTLGVATF